MRIVLCSLYFYPDMTSTCKYSTDMARWFARRGHEVDVIVGFPFYPAWRLSEEYPSVGYKRESLDNIRIHRIPHYVPRDGKVTSLRRVLIDLTFFFASLPVWIGLALSRRRPDVLISVCPPLFNGIPAFLLSAVRRVPWIFHIQDFQVDAAVQLGMLKLGPFGALLYKLENALIRNATRVATITPAMCRRAIAKGACEDKTWFLPNWADVRGLLPGPADNAFRQALNLPPDSFLAVYAGAMGAKQGLDLVIEAAIRLCDDPRFQFLMVGAGPEWQRLQDRAESERLTSITFLPVQPMEQLGDLLRAADVHLVIQKAEAADLVMPSKLTNILSVGRPAIATAGEGTALWDVLEGASTGCIVEPDKVDALVAALLKLRVNPDLRTRMGENARRYAEANLDQDAILRRFEQQLSLVTRVL